MGKTSVIKSLGRCIGNVALHKYLFKHTNKPESRKHLSDEIIDYGSDAFEKAQSYSWDDEEKQVISKKAYSRFIKLIRRYPDIEFDEKEAEELIKDTMKDMLIW